MVFQSDTMGGIGFLPFCNNTVYYHSRFCSYKLWMIYVQLQLVAEVEEE